MSDWLITDLLSFDSPVSLYIPVRADRLICVGILLNVEVYRAEYVWISGGATICNLQGRAVSAHSQHHQSDLVVSMRDQHGQHKCSLVATQFFPVFFSRAIIGTPYLRGRDSAWRRGLSAANQTSFQATSLTQSEGLNSQLDYSAPRRQYIQSPLRSWVVCPNSGLVIGRRWWRGSREEIFIPCRLADASHITGHFVSLRIMKYGRGKCCHVSTQNCGGIF